MTNIEKFNKVFTEVFMIKEGQLAGLKYQDIPEWDSIGQMNLIAKLEEEFNIELDVDDIVVLSSYEEGKEILKKYGVVC